MFQLSGSWDGRCLAFRKRFTPSLISKSVLIASPYSYSPQPSVRNGDNSHAADNVTSGRTGYACNKSSHRFQHVIRAGFYRRFSHLSRHTETKVFNKPIAIVGIRGNALGIPLSVLGPIVGAISGCSFSPG